MYLPLTIYSKEIAIVDISFETRVMRRFEQCTITNNFIIQLYYIVIFVIIFVTILYLLLYRIYYRWPLLHDTKNYCIVSSFLQPNSNTEHLNFRWETVPMHMGGLHVEIRAFRRTNAALSQAHRSEAVQVPSLSAIVFAERPFVASHEEALIKRTF